MFQEQFDNLNEGLSKTFKMYKKTLIKVTILIVVLLIVLLILMSYVNDMNKRYFNKEIKSSLNCTTNCEYSADSKNNYIWYGGLMFRIIGINSDNTIKLITEDIVSNVGFYTNESNSYYDSYVRLWLNESVFLKSLYKPDLFVSYHDFCYGDETDVCGEKIKDQVGLLNYDEYKKLSNGFINSNDYIWTMTKVSNSNSNVWYIDNNSKTIKDDSKASKTYGIKPVINLKANLELNNSGDGTKSNPYTLLLDKKPISDVKLNERNVGEFVRFAGKIWRISSFDKQSTTEINTKLILYGVEQPYLFDNTSSVKFSVYKTNSDLINLGYKLNSEYYNLLKGAVNDIDQYLSSSEYYIGELKEGDAFTNTLISNNNTSAKIGLIRMGEMFSGNDLNLTDVNTWTITPNGLGELWLTNYNLTSNPRNEYYYRPTITLKKNVYVKYNLNKDGMTKETAYELVIK